MSLIVIFLNMSLFVKFVIFMLIIMSIWCWGLYIEKLTVLKIKESLSISFEKEYNSGEMLDKIYNRLADKSAIHAPYARIFYAGMKELTMSNVKNIKFNSRYAEDIKKNIYNRILTAVNIERTKISNDLKKNINTIASCASLAPFIGLLGTVWGIMVTFRDISNAKTLNLTTVLPGISESLLATVIGLLCAIPAVFFYNSVTSRVNKFISDTEIFGYALANTLSRELDIIGINQNNKDIDEEKEYKKKMIAAPNDDDF